MNGSILKLLHRQNQELKKSPPEGITIINVDESHTIQVEIEGPSDTPYSDGLFRVKLCFTSEFPIEAPKGK